VGGVTGRGPISSGKSGSPVAKKGAALSTEDDSAEAPARPRFPLPGSPGWQSPAWRRTKELVDWSLIGVVCCAVAWTASNAVYLAQRSVTNRSIISVHMGSDPAVAVVQPAGAEKSSPLLRTASLTGTRTVEVTVSIANDGPDGLWVSRGTLSGPFLTSRPTLVPVGNGYVAGSSQIALEGEVTVNCTAAGKAADSVLGLTTVPLDEATTISLTATDADHATRAEDLTVDTTGFALQGQVCTR
jgi:hypothetical protein